MPERERMIPEEDAHRILETFHEKVIQAECPMCHRSNFSLIDGYLAPLMHKNLPDMNLFKHHQAFPMVAIMCTNCGFTSQHSLAPLGLMSLFTRWARLEQASS